MHTITKKVPPLLTLATLLVVSVPPLDGQETPRAVSVAERLQEEGRYSEAADTLLAHLRTHPSDVGVRWRAAQLLHRAGRSEAAAEQYEATVTLNPTDPWLRLEYADLLASFGQLQPARSMALPVAESGAAPDAARTRALTLLGTWAYWRGDLTAAVRHFEAALTMDPDQSDARRQLHEIQAVTRPWARLSLEGMDDNQPYRRGRGELELGVFINPLWTAALELVPQVMDPTVDGGAEPGTRTAVEARATLSGFLPAARLDVTAGFGGVRQDESTWTGHAGLGVRLPGRLTLEGRAARERYLWTTASADALLMVESVELSLERADHPGWAGEAVVQHESFPDGNGVATAYAWLLAPVAPGFRVGWAVSWQDAEESRWEPAVERYVPYFTPLEQRVSSALAEVTVPLGAAVARLNGSWGVWAREEVPGSSGSLPGNAPGRARAAERSYTPWSVVATLDAPAGEGISLRMEGERRATAFYTLTRGNLALVLRLGGASPR